MLGRMLSPCWWRWATLSFGLAQARKVRPWWLRVGAHALLPDLVGLSCSMWAGLCLVRLVLPPALPEALQRYLVLIYPGLVGAVTMVSCSILALTHLLFEFKGTCSFLKAWEALRVGKYSGGRQGGYQVGERSREGGRKAGAKPPISSAASHPMLRVGGSRVAPVSVLAPLEPDSSL